MLLVLLAEQGTHLTLFQLKWGQSQQLPLLHSQMTSHTGSDLLVYFYTNTCDIR